jgi:opacity protein-like surface antigen
MLNRLNITLTFFVVAAFATAGNGFSHPGLGVDVGIWKPSSLDSYPSQPLKNIDGASPYLGASLTLPIFKSTTVRASLMQWQQKDLLEVNLSSVTLRQLAVDLKYILLPQSTISPYACYGAAAIWSRELPENSPETTAPLDRAGWGFDVGAGIDFLLRQHWALGVEYQYIYAIFAKRVGLTDNYSGPKFTLRLILLF